ncbi:MAG: hypothetical protein ACRCX8_08515 [Sarcina sp.]
MKYIVCYSGGHSSALVAVEAVRRYGKENVILLNHDISSKVEDPDIKRFKNAVAKSLGIEITYANAQEFENRTPLAIARELGGFKFGTSPVLCTTKLKTEPFHKWLHENYPVKNGQVREDVVILYGFDKEEEHRIQRRSSIMAAKGYITDYPLAYWKRTIEKTEDIGIERPNTYKKFRHANCKGCLKAGKQSWYLVYCLYPELWREAVETENEIGFSILKDVYLEELEEKFKKMKCRGIVPSEEIPSQKFWSKVNKALPPINGQLDFLACECSM